MGAGWVILASLCGGATALYLFLVAAAVCLGWRLRSSRTVSILTIYAVLVLALCIRVIWGAY